MGFLKEAAKLGLKAGACVVIPAAAPTIIFSEVAKKAVRVAVQSDGGDKEDAKQAEKTAGLILGAGTLFDKD